MKILIEIDTENDAFVGRSIYPEIRRVLRQAVRKLPSLRKPLARAPEEPRSRVLLDLNGNSVGKVQVEGDHVASQGRKGGQ